ncbi:MAG: winged helix-turn-helix domain-containing protein, partial [Gemmatimonadales bacterium]
DRNTIRPVNNHALESDFDSGLDASTAATGIDLVAAEQPAIGVLDLGLPDAEGVDVCRELRAWYTAPILVISARHSETEKVALLDAGADDYITKPFSTSELQARVRALMRRASVGGAVSPQIEFGPYVMDLAGRTLRRDGELVHLTPIEWDLLRTLTSHEGRTLTHTQLFAAVWTGRKYGDAQQYLRTHVANLRRKIEEDVLDPHYIVTEPGIGYRFDTNR